MRSCLAFVLASIGSMCSVIASTGGIEARMVDSIRELPSCYSDGTQCRHHLGELRAAAPKDSVLSATAQLLGDLVESRDEYTWNALESADWPVGTDIDDQWCYNTSAGFYLLPVELGTLQPAAGSNVATATLNSSCFDSIQATMTMTESNKSASIQFVGQGSPKKLLCSDIILVLTSYGGAFAEVGELTPTVEARFDPLPGNLAVQDVKQGGMRVFALPCGVLGTIDNALATVNLFLGDGPGLVERNKDFLAQRGLFPKNPVPYGKHQFVPAENIRSGDYLAILRLDGLDPMIAFGSGGQTGHSAVAVWRGEELFVVESTDADPFTPKPYWPAPYGVIKTPWKQWFEQAINATYHVGLLPIERSLSDKWDEETFWKWFDANEGLPYGYNSFIATWIDDYANGVNMNLPLPLTDKATQGLFFALDKILPKTETGVSVHALVTMGLNKRLGLNCTDFDCATDEIVRRGIAMSSVIAEQEQDAWKYAGNYSMVCSVLAARAWQNGLGDAIPSFQSEEQMPVDNYRTKIYQPDFFNSTNCPVGLRTTPAGTFCQLMGPYELDLPDYNTVPITKDYNSKCPSQWPNYYRCPAGNPSCC